MPGRSATAALLGREKEQAELYDALSLALEGEPQVVVVAGDAGVGKTTIVADLAHRAGDLGFTVATGHGLDIEADISFAAIVEAVSTLVVGVEDLESRPLARRMHRLLDPATPRSAEHVNLLDDLRLTVLEAASNGPVLLVLEDVHWADESTRDLATALARTARGQLLFALTVRTDDLHRRHPARKALAEIGRVPGGRRVELGPLGRDSIAAMVASITGDADPTLVWSVMDRSEGNPLYAEEVASAGPGAVPDQLSDLFLARVDALSDGSSELARIASVDGTRVDIDTLAELANLDRELLNARLRELLDANVMRTVGDSLHFRHGLIREAVYDDLLPDERTRLHTNLAAILHARVDAASEPRLSVLSRLAFHSWAAHDTARALVASERAGMAAWRLGAAESVDHLERAISLWDRVPDSEALVGRTKIEVVISLARAALDQGDGERWHVLNQRAVDMLEPDTAPLVACRAYASLAFSSLSITDADRAPEAVRLAVEYAGDVPTEERAYALGAQALLHNANHRYTEGLDASDRAIDAARAAGALDALLLDLMFKAEALMHLGRMRESGAAIEHAVEVARTSGMLPLALDTVWQLAHRLLTAGQVERATAIAQAGREEALAAGLTISASFCGEALVRALLWDGRLDEAELMLRELGDLELTDDPWWDERADAFLARGDVEAAERALPTTARDLASASPPLDEDDALRIFRIAVLRGDEPRFLQTAGAYLALVQDARLSRTRRVRCANRLPGSELGGVGPRGIDRGGP